MTFESCGNINKLYTLEGGGIIVAGNFTNYQGTDWGNILLLTSTGAVDPSFTPGTGPDEEVVTCAFQSDGKIVVAGYFTSVSGTPRGRIARLNADGSLDTTFDPGTGPDYYIYSVALQADGKVIVGGIFDTFSGSQRHYLVRLQSDGSIDTTFDAGVGPDSTIFGVVALPDDTILIFGGFASYDTIPRYSVALVQGG